NSRACAAAGKRLEEARASRVVLAFAEPRARAGAAAERRWTRRATGVISVLDDVAQPGARGEAACDRRLEARALRVGKSAEPGLGGGAAGERGEDVRASGVVPLLAEPRARAGAAVERRCACRATCVSGRSVHLECEIRGTERVVVCRNLQ